MRNGRATAAALLVVAAACARCGRPDASPPERFLPADAPVSVVIPALRVAQEQLAAASRTALSFPAAAGQAQTLAALKDQLGFDPLDARGLEAAGLDLARGAAIAISPQAPPLVVLPVGDAGRLESVVGRLARDRLGAAWRDATTIGGHAITTFRAREGAPVAFSMVISDGTALLSAGADGPARVAAAMARPAAEALAGSAVFGRARTALGHTAALLAFAPPGSPALAGFALARDGAAIGISASASRATVRGAVLLPPDRRAFWGDALATAPSEPDAPERLPSDAFLVARFVADPATVARRLLPLGALAAPLRRAGLELERDLLDLLAPGVAAALSVAPTFEVAAVSRASELGADDPFRLVHLAAVLQLKDPDRAAAALDRLVRSAPQLGLRGARRPRAARWRLAWRGAALDLAIDGKRLLVGGGPGRLDALLAHDRPGYEAPTEIARSALAGGAAGGVLDLGQLVASFRALPARAYGTGPDAFVMRSLAERVIDPASRLVAASVRLDVEPEAALVEFTLEARTAEGGGR